jgi:hypothetical protein
MSSKILKKMSYKELMDVVHADMAADPFAYEMTEQERRINVIEMGYVRALSGTAVGDGILKKLKDPHFYFTDDKSPVKDGVRLPYFHYFLMSKEEIKFYRKALHTPGKKFNYTDALRRGEMWVESEERFQMLKKKYNF